MTLDVKTQINQAKNLIKAKQFDEARVILQRLDNPTAKNWLEKLDEIEMFGSPITSSRVTSVPTTQTHSADQLLRQTTATFLDQDWTVTTQFNDMVQLEKKRTPSSLGAALLLVVLGLIGMFIVLLAIATSKVEKVTLQALSDGKVQVTNRKKIVVISSPDQVKTLAESVKKGASYAATLALGIGSTIFWYVILYR